MFDVAIVGYGPAGASLSNLLGQAGLSVLVIEKDAQIYPLPRAIHFDGEVMRIFQAAGLKSAVQAITRPGLEGMHFVNAAGQTLLIRGGTAARGPHGSANNHYFHQPDLERVLREGVRRFANVQVRLQHELEAIEEAADHLRLTVVDQRHGRRMPFNARYLVGCDGARSFVRNRIGATMRDLGLHQPWLVFDVLLNEKAGELPQYTVQHCEPQRPMTYCNVIGNRRRWEIMLMPGDDPKQMTEHAVIWSLVRRWLGPEQATIERAAIYTFHSVIAQGWRRGRMMIAGDAAHQTPPFLGQGMCAGIRDVSNLAWKLGAVVRGVADPSLLDSYESERAPHVQAFIELAVRLGDIIQTTDPHKARERDARFLAGNPEVFQFPAPALGPGLTQGTHPQVGQIFPQPERADATLLDETLGTSFALIGRDTLLAQLSAADRALLARWDTRLVHADDAPLRDWLDRHALDAVLLRPDRWIMGVARDAAQLRDVVARLRAATLWPAA